MKYAALFIKEAFDAHLGDLAVAGQMPVGAAAYLLGDVGDGFFVETRLLDAVGIEINQGDKLSGTVDDHAFGYELALVDGSLHLFGGVVAGLDGGRLKAGGILKKLDEAVK